MKHSTLLTLFLLLILASAKEEQAIIWNENIKLTWKDYLGKPPANTSFLAGTTVTILFTDTIINGKQFFSAIALMNKNRSWLIPAHQNDAGLLRHEQLHFDIAELYARETRKHLANIRNLYPDSVFSDVTLKNHVDSFRSKAESENLRYDKESNHRKNKNMQEKWEVDVRTRLNELKDYK